MIGIVSISPELQARKFLTNRVPSAVTRVSLEL